MQQIKIHNKSKHKPSVYQSICLLNMPKIGLNNPPMGPAIMQSIAKELGSIVHFQDVNLSFQQWFSTNTHLLNDWCELMQPLTDSDLEQLDQFGNSLNLDTIFSSHLVGISIFSTHSFVFTKWFLETYRNKISGKIVVGGAGAGYQNYGKTLYEAGLVDFYVVNEGELSWRAILTNDLPFLGVNSIGGGLADFEHVPDPDYSGYKLDQYLNSQVYGITIGVEGSRGCVRNCTFCDIKSFWKKYKFKDGVRLANELISLKKQYDVQHFFFNDSLVNGSDRAFRDFISTLSEYNRSTQDKIRWSGYYIIKPAITYKENDWINLRDSGVKSLFIGIESGSESVRDHMKKKFSNDDIDHAMRKIQLYGIRCTWLLIIGYPTETQEDYEQTLELLKKYQPMALDRTIDTVALGMTLGIIDGSPLSNMRTALNIRSAVPEHDDAHLSGVVWQNEHSDFKTRVLRRIQAEELIRELGYNSWVGDNDMIAYFEKKLEQIQQSIVQVDDFAEYHG